MRRYCILKKNATFAREGGTPRNYRYPISDQKLSFSIPVFRFGPEIHTRFHTFVRISAEAKN